MNPRGFPPPLTVEELDACFVVRDQGGAIRIGAEFLTDHDLRSIYLAQRIADNVAKLQELLRR
jgi:hypothetical protein